MLVGVQNLMRITNKINGYDGVTITQIAKKMSLSNVICHKNISKWI